MAQTVSQVFASKGLWQWWAQNGGLGTNPYNGITEKGIDYANAWGTPVGVPVGGTVVRMVHNNNSIGDIVEIRAADGSVWLYQHITASVRVGQPLGVGSVVGKENGLPIDQYSTGPHIEVRYCPPGAWSASTISWNEPWVNPFSIFSGIGGQQAGSTGGSGGTGTGGTPGLPGLPTGTTSTGTVGAPGPGAGPPIINPLAPNADVQQFLIVLNELGTLVNPFVVLNAQIDNFLGITFDDPISYLSGVGTNMYLDARALIFRAILIFFGVILIYKVMEQFVDFGAVAGQAAGLASKAALAVL